MKYLLTSVSVMAVVAGLFITEARADLQFDSDVEPALKNQILADLQFMGSITSTHSTALHQQIFGQVNGADYTKWFEARVFTVGKQDCGSSIAVACVDPSYENKIWMTENYTKFDHPQIARLSVVYHEARHTESEHGNWGHATCPTPFLDDHGNPVTSIWTGAQLAGEAACDVTPFGSYGSQTILLKNIALNCSNCNSKVKADADIFATDQLGRIIDANAKNQMKRDFGLAREEMNIAI